MTATKRYLKEEGRMPFSAARLMVVLPTRNEAANIKSLIPAIRYALRGLRAEIVVVDEQSRDGTVAVAKEHGAVIVPRRGEGGLGSSIRNGIQVALARGGDIIVQMDADWQHRPEDILRVIHPIQDGKYNFTLGSRKHSRGWGSEPMTVYRRFLSQVAGFLAHQLVGVAARDPTSGFRAFDKLGAQAVLTTTEQGYGFQVEALQNLQKMQVDFTEIPIQFEQRKQGTSKLQALEMLRYLRMVLKCLLQNRFKQPSRDPQELQEYYAKSTSTST